MSTHRPERGNDGIILLICGECVLGQQIREALLEEVIPMCLTRSDN